MLKIYDNDVIRDGEKIGYVLDKHIWTRDEKKLGYYDEKYIYDMEGNKIAYIEGGFLYSMGYENTKTRLEEINKSITGGVFPEIAKCAIYVLLGG